MWLIEWCRCFDDGSSSYRSSKHGKEKEGRRLLPLTPKLLSLVRCRRRQRTHKHTRSHKSEREKREEYYLINNRRCWFHFFFSSATQASCTIRDCRRWCRTLDWTEKPITLQFHHYSLYTYILIFRLDKVVWTNRLINRTYFTAYYCVFLYWFYGILAQDEVSMGN